MEQQTYLVKIPCDHPLEYVSMADEAGPERCDGCGQNTGSVYHCGSCNFGAHTECIDFPEIINHTCHTRHPLKKVLAETIDYTDGKCHFCRSPLVGVMYHCSICNISTDVYCSLCPPPVTIHQPKSHEHLFDLMPAKVPFTCDACGMDGERNPYICFECNYMMHGECINLPRFININRHDHRISRTLQLGYGKWESCGVCRKEIDWTLGAFSCKRCPSYAVHSKCATREDVWDGEELEDEPEEEEEEDPFKVINEGEIIHFSHEHNLILGDGNVKDSENMRCDGCVSPINSAFFKCEQCEFFLNKVCASLPRKKQNILHNHKLVLIVDEAGEYVKCAYCLQVFNGFRYTCNLGNHNPMVIDVRCASISEPFDHELHPHPLYRTSRDKKTCGACGKNSEYVLRCTDCEFALGMECATLPRKVKHRCDDHNLTLHHGVGNSKGQLWCDICEGKTDPSVWFYGCDDCGTTLHISCVLGDIYYFKPGSKYRGGELVANNGMTRPYCMVCGRRCMFPFSLKDSTRLHICSMECADDYYCKKATIYERSD